MSLLAMVETTQTGACLPTDYEAPLGWLGTGREWQQAAKRARMGATLTETQQAHPEIQPREAPTVIDRRSVLRLYWELSSHSVASPARLTKVEIVDPEHVAGRSRITRALDALGTDDGPRLVSFGALPLAQPIPFSRLMWAVPCMVGLVAAHPLGIDWGLDVMAGAGLGWGFDMGLNARRRARWRFLGLEGGVDERRGNEALHSTVLALVQALSLADVAARHHMSDIEASTAGASAYALLWALAGTGPEHEPDLDVQQIATQLVEQLKPLAAEVHAREEEDARARTALTQGTRARLAARVAYNRRLDELERAHTFAQLATADLKERSTRPMGSSGERS